MRPVVENMCTMGELKDCTLDLVDVAMMNEALDIRAENIRRMTRAR